jgi:L-2,4-diaminobutyric acid acetyltransferase
MPTKAASSFPSARKKDKTLSKHQPEMDKPISPSVIFRAPNEKDAVAVWRLVQESDNLDKNSFYCYFLLCTFFSRTCAVAEYEGGLVGFVSGFLLPQSPSTLFLWQIRVSAGMKSKGIGYALITDILNRHEHSIDTLKASIYPNNERSQALFRSIAKKLEAQLTIEENFITKEMFPIEMTNHEPEFLFTIGPIQKIKSSS